MLLLAIPPAAARGERSGASPKQRQITRRRFYSSLILRSRMQSRWMDDEVMVVEDSDPEPEPLRRQASGSGSKETLMDLTGRQQNLGQLYAQTLPRDLASLQQRLVGSSDSTCLAISSGSDQCNSGPTTSASRRLRLPRESRPFHHIENIQSTPRLSVLTDLSDDKNEDRLDLSRFAYKNARKHITKYSGHGAPLQSASFPSTANTGTKTSSRSRIHPAVIELLDLDLSKLLKCVSCDVKWTTRKNATQKQIHIKSCAKKRGLTIETIRVLIMNEIQNAPLPGDSDKGKGKGKEPEIPKTFMTEVVDGAIPKKRGKHPEVMHTIRAVNDIRESIMERARAILDASDPISKEEWEFENPTQVFQPSKLVSVMAVNEDHTLQNPTMPTHLDSPTGPGGRSAQALERSRPRASDQIAATALIFPSQSYSSTQLPLQPTQPRFHEGKKGFVDKLVHASLGYSEQRSVSTGIQDKGEDPGLTDYYRPEYDDFTWNDDAFLHFDPDKRVAPSIEHGCPSVEDEVVQRLEQSRISEALPGDTRWSRQKPSHHKESVDYEVEISDDDLEKTIIDHVLSDKELHLRILRYEPISFDVFLQLAAEPTLNTNRLRFKLRPILDTLGVNFYCADSQWRTRR